jgi:glutamate N-acetyltransferase / amino-acid N-acetyltransferase
MAVNLAPPDPATLEPIAGVDLGVAMAGIRKAGRRDLLVMRLAPGSTIAGVFTNNRFCAAPVTLSKSHLAAGWDARGFVVNTGNANAGTGADGVARARSVCEGLARALGCAVEQILPFSTGVIMEPLPVEPILAALPSAVGDLRPDHWARAAETIMTTDTVPKAYSERAVLSGGEVRVTGIAKGAGMIRPDMATMLAFVATDAVVERGDLERLLRAAAARSFHCITVDGDMSTNDAFMLVATGGAGVVAQGADDLARLGEAIDAVAMRLAQAIVRDAEGATKFVTLQVEGGRDEAECRSIAYAIAHSPLVKTAFFASDPNLGRILAAIGYSGVPDLDPERIDLYLDGLRIARGGARDPGYVEAQALEAMRKPEFELRVVLDRGPAVATLWTCDLSYDYVKINAEYRT